MTVLCIACGAPVPTWTLWCPACAADDAPDDVVVLLVGPEGDFG